MFAAFMRRAGDDLLSRNDAFNDFSHFKHGCLESLTSKFGIRHSLVRCFLLLAVFLVSKASAQEVLQPWEYRPYKTHCWLAIDPSLDWSDARKQYVSQEIARAIEDRFGPTVTVTTQPTPQNFEGDILYSSQAFDLNNLLGRELVIVTTKKTKEGKESRTVKAALERFKELHINSANLEEFRRGLESSPTTEGFSQFATMLKADAGPTSDVDGKDPVAVKLLNGEISIGVISRGTAKAYPKDLTILPTVYPWHLQSELAKYDKILTVNLKRADYGILIELRELDCLFRSVGPMYALPTISEQMVALNCAQLASEAFVPMVRMESADDQIAKVRVRAGELIPETNKEENPCFIGKGDVLRPIIRRDNLRGEPQMIQYIPWTYLVAFESMKSDMNCAIISGTRGALLGRPNRRLFRMATLVKPSNSKTELKLRVANNPIQNIPGNSIFRRTPGSDDLVLIGRSDWRGIIDINYEQNPIVTYELPATKATAASDANSAKPTSSTDAKPDAAASTNAQAAAPAAAGPDATAAPATATTDKPTETPAPAAAAAPASNPDAPPKGQVQANVPLYIYHVKSGNSLLAKLPIVTGDETLQVADLPDDSKRLEAEALIRGLEGRIFDIVALRLILATKIEAALESNNMDEAKKLLNQLKTTKDYEGFSSDLNAIQSRILSSASTIPKGAQKRIDRMFEETRKSLQKYLQDSHVRQLEIRFLEKQKAMGAEPTGDSAAAAAEPATNPAP